jgi:hypothetical protein
LIVPAIEKVYLVNNGCADAITVKNSSGTGIAVPAGKTMWVYNNGTNVVDAVTHLTSLTLGTALPIASGGTGSNAGINASVNVFGILPVANGGTGVTASTGTGSVVLSASPTLTGVPLSTTAANGTNTTQIATTAFVTNSVTIATGSLGTMSTQNANAVAITGGTISGGTISGITDLAIADGGTGASTAESAFTNLKQTASDTATGVVELATVAEVQTGTDTTRAITPAGFYGASLGWGQTWTDVTGSRVKATTYTNSTGRPIMVAITCTSSGSPSPYTLSGFVNGINILQSSTGFDIDNLTWIVPNGATYKIELASTATSILIWAELR